MIRKMCNKSSHTTVYKAFFAAFGEKCDPLFPFPLWKALLFEKGENGSNLVANFVSFYKKWASEEKKLAKESVYRVRHQI